VIEGYSRLDAGRTLMLAVLCNPPIDRMRIGGSAAMKFALGAIMLWLALALAGLSLVMKLDPALLPSIVSSQEYWLAFASFLALLVPALYARGRDD
jgi:hypothetical protein